MTDDRRNFLKKASFSSLALLGLNACVSKEEKGTIKKTNLSSSGGIVTRRDISQLKDDDQSLEMLKAAVKEMRRKSEITPLHPEGWYTHARIHDMFCFTSDYKLQIHFTWLFYPWHRAFLWFLEKKLQAAINEPSLALHYWDWTKTPHIPHQYWGDDNPLHDITRLATPNDIIPYDYFSIESYMRAPGFKSFGGAPKAGPDVPFTEGVVEQGLHNGLHNWIGGNMDNFATAADDPIFTGHHGNVDRIWDAWLAADPSHKNPEDPRFLDHVFYFTDAYGIPTTIKINELLNTEELGYRFENLDFTKIFDESGSIPKPSGKTPLATQEVKIDDSQRQSIADAITTGYRRVILEFDRFQVPGIPVAVRIFLHEKGVEITEELEKAAYVATITVLPVHVPNSSQLAPEVIMQTELKPACVELILSGKPLAVTLEPVKVPQRNIPDIRVSIEDIKIRFDEG